MYWIDGLKQRSYDVAAELITFALPMTLGPTFSTRAIQLPFARSLGERVQKFALELAEDKTRWVEFGRYARDDARKRGEKPKEFTFLGFTHYCGKTKKGYFKVKRRTSRKKLGQSLRKFIDWARRARSALRKGEMLRQARNQVNGHLNYYAITDNSDRCSYYVYRVKRTLLKWLNRKSQRRTYAWPTFSRALACIDWQTGHIRKDLSPCRRAEAY